jgi:hypothetical protein
MPGLRNFTGYLAAILALVFVLGGVANAAPYGEGEFGECEFGIGCEEATGGTAGDVGTGGGTTAGETGDETDEEAPLPGVDDDGDGLVDEKDETAGPGTTAAETGGLITLERVFFGSLILFALLMLLFFFSRRPRGGNGA